MRLLAPAATCTASRLDPAGRIDRIENNPTPGHRNDGHRTHDEEVRIMASRPRRAQTSPAEPHGRPGQNPGGPLTEEDRADARALLWPVSGTGFERHAALLESRIHDHTAPTYDPNRIVRILMALRDALAEEIADWKHGRVSRAATEQRWEEFLFSDHCARCTQSCHTCREWAAALGYERVELDDDRATWRRPDEQPTR